MASVPSAVEIIPGRLYYVTLRYGPSESAARRAHFWSADEFTYWNFFLDWGPLSLGNVYRFCRTLQHKIRSDHLQGKVIYVYSEPHAHKRTNAAFLLCAWLVLYNGRSPEEAFAPFQEAFPPFPPFHDASPAVCTYDLSVLDCLQGMHKAFHFGLIDFHNFDVDEYEHYEQVEHGDLNWIANGKFLAFAGPHSHSEITREGYRTLTPSDYIPYFKEHNVTLVVRLNKKYYDEQEFLDEGIDHLDAYFVDGSVPPPSVLRQFMATCEATPGAIAVHCKAGLGRTGTCIGCYLMKHYGFTAAEAIGWMRIGRPGSVIGPQQHFLEQMEGPMWREGAAFRRRQASQDAQGGGAHSKPTAIDNNAIAMTGGGRGTAAAAVAAAAAAEQEIKQRRTVGAGGVIPHVSTRGAWDSSSSLPSTSSPLSPARGAQQQQQQQQPLGLLAAERATDVLCQHLARLGKDQGGAAGGVGEFDRATMRRARQTATRRASAPPPARDPQLQSGVPPTAVRPLVFDAAGRRIAKTTAAAAAAVAAAAAAAAAAGGGGFSSQRPNCTSPTLRRGGTLDVLREDAAGGRAGGVSGTTTQGDLLRQQRARGGIGGRKFRR